MQFPGIAIAVAGSDVTGRTETLSTTETTADLGDVGTPGVIWIWNLGSVDVRFGCHPGNYTGRVKPGECWPFRLDGTVVYWRCVSSTCRIEYWVVSN